MVTLHNIRPIHRGWRAGVSPGAARSTRRRGARLITARWPAVRRDRQEVTTRSAMVAELGDLGVCQ